MGLTNFRAEDFNGSEPIKNMVRSKRDRLAGPVATTQPRVAPDANPEDVPSGTVPEVMTWVGEDPVRAQKALDVEESNDRPRKGLVSALNEKLAAPAEDEDEAPDTDVEEDNASDEDAESDSDN